ncbi:MAG: ArnT family glycosyltransferase [Burkholderiaceae bacterium]
MLPEKQWVRLLWVVGVLPLVAMALIPLSDTSEPRYAEIARLMVETGDWITPWFAPDVPFWGKPPLSFWAQALSFKLFGVNEFAARFPSWVVTAGAAWLLYQCVATLFDRLTARLASLIYLSGALVFVASGAVLTDPFLALAIMLCLTGPRMAVLRPTPFWRYAFFLGLAAGMLAKGPLVLVLSAGALLPWFALFPDARSALKQLPWGRGLLLTVLLSVPWYLAAELKTPGFWDYFLVGEHVRRFVDPGWAGDRYGTAHQAPYGTIWFYWLQATFPWGVAALVLLAKTLTLPRQRQVLANAVRDERLVYFLMWSLFTPLFFTFSGNILWTYLLPAIGGFSVVLARAIVAGGDVPGLRWRHRTPWLALLAPAAVGGLTVLAWVSPQSLKTEKQLVAYVHAAGAGDKNQELLYLDEVPFSARFYSRNASQPVSFDHAMEKVMTGKSFWLAVPKERADEFAGRLPVEKAFESRRYVLLHARGGVTGPLASSRPPAAGVQR